MTVSEIKGAIVSSSDLSVLLAESWKKARRGLLEITDADYRETPVEQYPLQLLCLVEGEKDSFHQHNSAEKEQIVERLKAVLNPVGAILGGGTELELPTYSLVSGLTPRDGEQSFFADQLKEDFKRLNHETADALATALYGVVYADSLDFEDGVVAFALRQLLDDPFDIGNFARMTDEDQLEALNAATKKIYGTPHTNAAASAVSSASCLPGNVYHPRTTPGKWLPLKLYLIITTLFVALVFGLVFFSMSSGVGAAAMSIMDTSGQMVAIEPGMEPATLFLFGTVDYDGLIAGIKNAAIIFVVWRVMLTTAVYLFNARRRRLHP